MASRLDRATGEVAEPAPGLRAPPIAMVGVLGPLEWSSEQGGSLPRSRRPRAILGFLATTGGAPVARAKLSGLIWDRVGEAQAKQSLRQALVQLRQSLGPLAARVLGNERSDTLAFDARLCRLDLRDVLQDPALYDGELRPGMLLEDLDGVSPSFDEWLASERRRVDTAIARALEKHLAGLEQAKADAASVMEAAHRIVAFDPTHEPATRTLMLLHVQAGDRAEAIREYERCREALRRLLDTPPSARTTAIFDSIRISTRPAAAIHRLPLPREGDARETVQPSAAPAPDTSSSIAVLPLRNAGETSDASYAGEGIVDDVIDFLSRVPTLFVVSRLSTLRFRERDSDVSTIAGALGVRYVLDGSFRLAGRRIRVAVQLTDARKGRLVWSSRFDGELDDGFALHDRIAQAIARQIAPYVHESEFARIRAIPTHSLAAHELVLSAIDAMHRCEREPFFDARRRLDAAIARDPGYAAAHAWIAKWHLFKVGQGWSDDYVAEADAAEAAANVALSLDRTEPLALAVTGHIAAYLRKDFDTALARFEHALRINPNAAGAWQSSAATHAYMDLGSEAVARARKAIALTPFDPLLFSYTCTLALAHLAAGEWEQVVQVGHEALRQNRRYTATHRVMAIALVQLGRIDAARAVAAELMSIEPAMSIARFRARYPALNPATLERYATALARCGVP